MESFFHLFKTELLDGFPPCKDLAELKSLSAQYIHYFNYQRISLKTKGMTPVEYRNHLGSLNNQFCLTFLLHFTTRYGFIFYFVLHFNCKFAP